MAQQSDSPWRNEERLRALYKDEDLSTYEIADRWDCYRRTVTNWLYRHGLKTPSGDEPWKDKERLEELNRKQGQSPEEIADELGCSKQTIQRWLMRHGFKNSNQNGGKSKPWQDKETLERLYVEEDMTVYEVGDELGCSHETINRWTTKLDVGTEESPWKDEERLERLYLEEELPVEEVAERLNCGVYAAQRWLDRYGITNFNVKPWKDEEKLGELYHDKGLSALDIGQRWDCSRSTICRWLGEFDIETGLSKFSEEALRELWVNEGLEAGEIAARLDCSATAVYRWIREYNIDSFEGQPWRDRERLEEMYVEEGLNGVEIAEEWKCGASTIHRWLRRFEIESPEDHPWRDEETLKEWYIERDMSSYELAEHWDCDQSTIGDWLSRYSIKKEEESPPWQKEEVLRELYVEQGLSDTEVAEELGCNRSTVNSWLIRLDIETRDSGGGGGPWQNEERLRELYLEEDLTVMEIADRLDCSHGTISYWLAKHGIQTNAKVTHQMFNHENDDYGPWKEPDLLRNLYCDKHLSTLEISQRLDCSANTIRRYLDRFDISRDEDKELIEEEWVKEEIEKDHPWRDKSLLRYLYQRKDLSQNDIAEVLGCSQGTVSQWFRNHDIDTGYGEGRPSKERLEYLYDTEDLSGEAIARQIEVAPNTVYRWLREYDMTVSRSRDVPETLTNKERMQELYIEEENTVLELADRFGSAPATIRMWLDKHGVERRSRSEALRGERHPFYEGGENEYGVGWTKQKKDRVRERDENKCQSCGIDREEYQAEYGRDLDVHHVIPARDFDDPKKRNAADNLVTLCRKCHHKWEGIPVRPTLGD